MSGIEARLAELGLELPQAMAPIANYVPFVRSGALVVVSGQVPARDGRIAVTGKLGAGLDAAAGQEAARLCFLNVLAQLRAACDGDLGRALGMDNRWAYNAIKQVGNYGDMWERSITPIGLPRGPNALWTRGGLQFAPPLR